MYPVSSGFYDFMIVIGIVLAIAMIGLFIVVFITVAKTADSANKATKNLVDQMKDQKTYTLDQLNEAKRQAWYQGYSAAVQQTDGIKHTMDNIATNDETAANEADDNHTEAAPTDETAIVEKAEVIETATDTQHETQVANADNTADVKDADKQAAENSTSNEKTEEKNA